MLQSNFTARSGLIAQQERMDIIAHNVANINTVGYKTVRADFKDMLYRTMQRPIQPQDELNLQQGTGTLLGASTRDFTAGSTQISQNPLDLMIVGNGFFSVQDVNGDVLYTRDGSFKISEEEDGNFLVAPDGAYVLDTNGERINLGNALPSNIEIDSEGNVVALQEQADGTLQRNRVGQLGLFDFDNRMGLSSESGNRFAETENSGEPVAATGSSVRQGALENSNVDLATEMTRLIRAQRAFSLASRALITADEMDAKANQLRS